MQRLSRSTLNKDLGERERKEGINYSGRGEKVVEWIYKKGSEMGIKEIGLSLMLFCHLCLLAAPSPRHNTLPSVLLQENNIKDIEKDKNSKSGSNIGGSGIVRRNSVSHRGGAASASGGHGGRSPGTGDHGNNGDSTNPTTAGTAVIPIYAAGAANGHRPNNHKSAGSRTSNCLGLPTLGAATLATLALHVNVEFWI